tara:strand:+ start:597 stop:944 length:348 start_codon:yes stop_codon:yes gene_type:complete
MDTQIRTIDVDGMHITGKKDSCSIYVLYHRVRRKYIVPIENDIKNYSDLVSNTKNFGKNKYQNKVRILSLFDYIMSNFDQHDLKKILSKEHTNLQFIHEAYRIRYANEKSTDTSV